LHTESVSLLVIDNTSLLTLVIFVWMIAGCAHLSETLDMLLSMLGV